MNSALRILVLAILVGPSAALAQTEEADRSSAAVERIQRLNDEARAAFQGYAFRKAEQKLDQALDLAAAANLGAHPKVAETYVLRGVAAISGSNDLYRGLHYFVRAVRAEPKITVPLDLATPQLLQMFKEATRTVKSVKQPPTISVGQLQKERAGADGTAKKTGRGLKHAIIDSAKRGYPVPVKATPGLDIQAHRVFLYYRPEGKVKFVQVPMKKSRGTFRGDIAPEATSGRYLHYYIEAVDQRGRLAGSQGSARSPNVVIISN